MDTKMKIAFVEVPARQLITVPIELINDVPAPKNKARQVSLLELGQADPVRLRQLDDGRFGIIDGRRRVVDAIEAGLTEVEAIVENVGDTQAALLSLVLNLSRSPSPMVEARLLSKLIGKYTQQQLAKMLGISQGRVSQLLSLLDLIPELQRRFEVGEITLDAARAAKKLSPDQQRELAKLDRVTVGAAKEMLRSSQAEQVCLSDIDIPDLPQGHHIVTLSDDQVMSLESGQPVTIDIKGKRYQIITL